MFPKRPPRIEDIESGTADLKQADERISYDKERQQWVFESEAEGTEYGFSYDEDKWIKTEASVSRKRRHLTEEDAKQDGGAVEKENREAIKRIKKERLAQMREEIKRLKAASTGVSERSGTGSTADSDVETEESSSSSTVTTATSSALYVTQLPPDVTLDELAETFGKYGMLAEDLVTGDKRIKMYKDKDGAFKQEALVVYLNRASAQMALDMLDNVYLRGPARDKQHIHVEFARQKTTDSQTAPKKQLSEEDRRRLQQRKQELKRKLTEWDDDENSIRVEDARKRILDKQIVIANMFRQLEFKSDTMLEQDVKDDIVDECGKHGIVIDSSKITVYDGSGVVVVKFNDSELAQKCMQLFEGRYYDGLKLDVSVATGEKYVRTGDTESEDGRLESFGKWLQEENKD